MIRRIFRLAGFLLLAAGLVVTVIDGARWIGTQVYTPMPLGVMVRETLGGRMLDSLRVISPVVHDWIVQPVLALPAFAVIFLAALTLLWIGAPRAVTIGFEPRP